MSNRIEGEQSLLEDELLEEDTLAFDAPQTDVWDDWTPDNDKVKEIEHFLEQQKALEYNNNQQQETKLNHSRDITYEEEPLPPVEEEINEEEEYLEWHKLNEDGVLDQEMSDIFNIVLTSSERGSRFPNGWNPSVNKTNIWSQETPQKSKDSIWSSPTPEFKESRKSKLDTIHDEVVFSKNKGPYYTSKENVQPTMSAPHKEKDDVPLVFKQLLAANSGEQLTSVNDIRAKGALSLEELERRLISSTQQHQHQHQNQQQQQHQQHQQQQTYSEDSPLPAARHHSDFNPSSQSSLQHQSWSPHSGVRAPPGFRPPPGLAPKSPTLVNPQLSPNMSYNHPSMLVSPNFLQRQPNMHSSIPHSPQDLFKNVQMFQQQPIGSLSPMQQPQLSPDAEHLIKRFPPPQSIINHNHNNNNATHFVEGGVPNPNAPHHPLSHSLQYAPQHLSHQALHSPIQTVSNQQRSYFPRWTKSYKRMSAAEIDNIILMQYMQITSSRPFVDDYYYQVKLSKSSNGKVIPHTPLCDEFEQLNSASKPFQQSPDLFVGVLGRIPMHSVRAPRPLLHLDEEETKPTEASDDKVTFTKTRTLRSYLMHIENIWDILLEIEDLDNIAKNTPNG
eukprot:TRINITY_DN3180_c0_g1_i5.p1 TRINITY_DN3180_c0_g1~~TRINITY_DN3180_c0_g1_i5.p1  ORF type:complete len:622 (-),score=128.12 TRINITY_DN3180_c0_g1_i5:187-2028(-)